MVGPRARVEASRPARNGCLAVRARRCHPSHVLVYAIVDDSLSRCLLCDSIDVFVRREDAERFIEEIRGDDPDLAKPLRIEERELEAGGLN
jgi:hypothetical protein